MGRSELHLVEEDLEGERLDAFLAETVADLSRTAVKELITNGQVLVDGKSRKPSYRIKEGEEILITLPEARQVAIVPQDLPLEIIYQDQDIAVVNKPKGMVVHPAHGNWDGTMVNALLYHTKDLSAINGEIRPGIVHRLDKDTSGVMVVAKNDQAHRNLAEQIKEHTIKREYQALVHGMIKENLGSIEAPIGRSRTDARRMAVFADGKPALVLSGTGALSKLYAGAADFVTAELIRSSAFFLHKTSVVGDPVYGPANTIWNGISGLACCRLGFIIPVLVNYGFTSELPKYLRSFAKNHQYTLTD